MLPNYVNEVLEDLFYAGVETADDSIDGFFNTLWADGEIEFSFRTWGEKNASMMDLLFIVNESATEADKQKLEWLIGFLKELDGSRYLKFDRISVAYAKQA